jgi:hypothetical protein
VTKFIIVNDMILVTLFVLLMSDLDVQQTQNVGAKRTLTLGTTGASVSAIPDRISSRSGSTSILQFSKRLNSGSDRIAAMSRLVGASSNKNLSTSSSSMSSS